VGGLLVETETYPPAPCAQERHRILEEMGLAGSSDDRFSAVSFACDLAMMVEKMWTAVSAIRRKR
jgi:hypothetical protein